jgi:hypothetical protein
MIWLLTFAALKSSLIFGQDQKNDRFGTQRGNDADQPFPTNHYVHKWIKFPEIRGTSINGGELTISPGNGVVTILFFIASWSVESQDLIESFQRVQERYRQMNTRFVYIFTHDTLVDAINFAKEYKIDDGLLSSHDILQAFNNPPPPTVYISDAKGWITSRYVSTKIDDLIKINHLLKLMTAI